MKKLYKWLIVGGVGAVLTVVNLSINEQVKRVRSFRVPEDKSELKIREHILHVWDDIEKLHTRLHGVGEDKAEFVDEEVDFPMKGAFDDIKHDCPYGKSQQEHDCLEYCPHLQFSQELDEDLDGVDICPFMKFERADEPKDGDTFLEVDGDDEMKDWQEEPEFADEDELAGIVPESFNVSSPVEDKSVEFADEAELSGKAIIPDESGWFDGVSTEQAEDAGFDTRVGNRKWSLDTEKDKE